VAPLMESTKRNAKHSNAAGSQCNQLRNNSKVLLGVFTQLGLMSVKILISPGKEDLGLILLFTTRCMPFSIKISTLKVKGGS
jgi:hypothetical protein